MKPLPLLQPTPTGIEDCCATGACTPDAMPKTTDTTLASSGGGGEGDQRTVLRVDGMDCASCAVTLERVVRAVPGVERAVVNFAAARLDVQHDQRAGERELTAAVGRAGFSVRPSGVVAATSWWRSRRAGLLAIASMLTLVALVATWGGERPARAWEAVFVAAIALGGWSVFRAALVGVRARHLDMNVLMAVATIGAGVLGQWAEAASIVLLFSLGNLLQVAAIARTRAAVAAMAELTPTDVRVADGAGGWRDSRVGDVAVGAFVMLRPGERAALDGIVSEGSTTVDESAITGESAPVEKLVGDEVYSGSLNGAGSVTVRVERPATESTVQRIAQLVEQAQATKAPAEQFVERFAAVYTPLVVGAAALLAIVPSLITDDWGTWTYRALALLIIACPCSLVISTPVTVVSGIGAASRRGILIKGGAALEAAGHLRAIAIDKTGTLTEGRPTLVSQVALGGVAVGDALARAAALERRSEHPLAHAILSAAGDAAHVEVADFASLVGRGATGTISGVEHVIGSPRLFSELGIDLGGTTAAHLEACAERGETPVLLGTRDRALAVFGLADTVRPDAPAAIAALRAAGIEHVTMLTGDSEGAARRVATELGIDYRAQLLPADKVAAIRELEAQYGAVGMVGDGVNDAPALATASVSFAMGAAASGAALETADIALMQDDLRKLVESVELSRASSRVLRQNLAVSIVVKGVCVLLAPLGLVTLWVAVAADLGTSLGVTANGLRLFRRGGRG